MAKKGAIETHIIPSEGGSNLVAMTYRWVRTLSATKSSHTLPSAGGCGPARRDSPDLERFASVERLRSPLNPRQRVCFR